MLRRLYAPVLFCLLCNPAFANPAIDEHLDAMAGATSEQIVIAATQALVELGPIAVPGLTDRLLSSREENERVYLTFALASIISQARGRGETILLPNGLAEEVAALLQQPADIALEANLANMAALFEPQPLAITDGLLALLARTNNGALRATTSAVIALHAEPSAIPLIHEALRNSPSETFSGDIARILVGTDLPDDIIEIVKALLSSDNPEARQSAARLLDDAGMVSPAQLDAALTDLEIATTDMQLLNAAMAVRNYTDGSARVADALEQALTKASRVEERIEIIRAFGASGAAGQARLAEIIETAKEPEIVRHLMFGALASPELRESQIIAKAFIALVVTAADAAVADQAAFALSRYQEIARPAIETMLAGDNLPPESRDRLTAIFKRR